MKTEWTKDILLTLLPIVISGIGYLLMTVVDLQEKIEELEDSSHISRDQLKDELKDQIHDIDKRVIVLESKQ
jgi:hypothetical protein